MSVTCAPSVSKLGLKSLDKQGEQWVAKHLSHRSTSTEAGSNGEGSCGTGSSTPSAVPTAPRDAAPSMYSAATAAEARRAAAQEGRYLQPPQTPGKTRTAAGDQGLVQAAAVGDLESVTQLLMAGASPNSQGPDGTTSLCAAAMWGHAKVVTFLLSAGAAPNLANRSGSGPTPLHAAALQEHGKICMLLLAAGADPNIVDTAGVSSADVASCSEALWPHFAAKGCERTSKLSLAERGVIRKVSSTTEHELGGAENAVARQAGLRGLIPEFSRPGSSYVLTSKVPLRPGSSMGRSSSLCSLVQPLSRGGSRGGSRPNSRGKILSQTIDILGDGLCELPSRPNSRAGLRKSGSLASLGL